MSHPFDFSPGFLSCHPRYKVRLHRGERYLDEHPGRVYPPTQAVADAIAKENDCRVELFRAEPPHEILFTA